jgi:hydroxymethylglutaryl-CoA lyase
MPLPDTVKIVECPRDAWQGLPEHIPAETKADYLRQLIGAGFRHIDAVSFVSPGAVPQMADSEKVLELLNPPSNVEIIGIVVNSKGAERAIVTNMVRTLGFPYSVSPSFLKRNQNQTPPESLEVLKTVVARAHGAGLDVVAYISMAFGNPYGDDWSIEAVIDAIDALMQLGVRQISLADTVGLATPEQIFELLMRVLAVINPIEIGVHLHARPDQAAARILAAYKAGCRRFDAAIGGLGGCPFAQDDLVGNIPTETLIEVLTDAGAQLSVLHPLDVLIRENAGIAAKFSTILN